MAFTGSATIVEVAERKFRITGLSLAASAAGTISFTPGTGAVKFTAPNWTPYNTGEGAVSLQDAIQVTAGPAGSASAATAVPARIVKAGTTQADFTITITNDDGAAATSALEIYVELH